jgi:hypothetical protein
LFRFLKQTGNHRALVFGETQRQVVTRYSILLSSKEAAMTDIRTILANLRRPRLLIRAARFGLEDYRRDRDLRRLVKESVNPDKVLPELLAEEARLEQIRRTGDLNYPVARHVEVLVALMAEVNLLPRRIAQ